MTLHGKQQSRVVRTSRTYPRHSGVGAKIDSEPLRVHTLGSYITSTPDRTHPKSHVKTPTRVHDLATWYYIPFRSADLASI